MASLGRVLTSAMEGLGTPIVLWRVRHVDGGVLVWSCTTLTVMRATYITDLPKYSSQRALSRDFRLFHDQRSLCVLEQSHIERCSFTISISLLSVSW